MDIPRYRKGWAIAISVRSGAAEAVAGLMPFEIIHAQRAGTEPAVCIGSRNEPSAQESLGAVSRHGRQAAVAAVLIDIPPGVSTALRISGYGYELAP
jgi:hypothetical protein